MRILLSILISLTLQTAYTQEVGFAGSRDGRVTLENLQKSKKLYIKAQPDWTIVSWDCLIAQGGKIALFPGTGNVLTGDLLVAVHKLGDGSGFSFSNIVVQDTLGNNFRLQSLIITVYTINK
jgi:hypothetical protein